MPYQCSRQAFTQEQYDSSADYFCAVPSAWGRPPYPTRLAQLYRAGGLGAIAIYPALGQYAHASFAGEVRLSKQELARLTGRDVRTVAKGAEGLAALGLVESERAWYRRQPITQWSIRPEMAVPLIEGRLHPDYFYFPSRFLHGGQWAKFSGVQQAVFLAVATNSRALSESPEDSSWVRDRLRLETALTDLQACYEYSRVAVRCTGLSRRSIRVSELSYTQLADITGLSQSAVKAAVNKLKHPDHWPGAQNEPRLLRYSPLAVYRTEGGPLVYHIRDHAPHWPWDELNQPSPQAAIATVSASEERQDDDWPF